jgi:DNA polymerase-3 subunit delta
LEYHEIKKEVESGKLANVYFFFGEEIFPINTLIRKIIDKGTNPATRDFNCDILDGETTDGQTVTGIASSFPMADIRRIVVLKSVQKFSSSDRKSISEYIKSPLESTCLVITAGKIERTKKFYVALLKNSRWVECKPLYENQAIEWIKRAIRQKDVILSHEGATYLVQQVGTSLWMLYNEVEKLLTYTWGKKKLDLKDVNFVVGISRKYNTWEFTDAVARKDIKKSLIILAKLLEMKQSAVGLIMDLTRRLRILIHIRTMLDLRNSQQQISSVMKLKPYFAKLYINQANQFSMEELENNIKTLLLADYSIKTGYLNPDMVLTLVVYDLIKGRTGKRFFFNVC